MHTLFFRLPEKHAKNAKVLQKMSKTAPYEKKFFTPKECANPLKIYLIYISYSLFYPPNP
ncbi:MAG: hypothetical protein IJ780_00555 [Neisseriaceae bacterium]|nr:hypothetical protein [Neisseriaceae bacterium]